MRTARNLAILIFEEVEMLDFCGPFEVFSVASSFTESPAFNVFTVAEKGRVGPDSWWPQRQPALPPNRLPPARRAARPRWPGHPQRIFVPIGE